MSDQENVDVFVQLNFQDWVKMESWEERYDRQEFIREGAMLPGLTDATTIEVSFGVGLSAIVEVTISELLYNEFLRLNPQLRWLRWDYVST